MRLRIHRRLIDTLDLSKLSNLEMERVRVEIRRILEELSLEIATPDEAREMLGLKGKDAVAF